MIINKLRPIASALAITILSLPMLSQATATEKEYRLDRVNVLTEFPTENVKLKSSIANEAKIYANFGCDDLVASITTKGTSAKAYIEKENQSACNKHSTISTENFHKNLRSITKYKKTANSLAFYDRMENLMLSFTTTEQTNDLLNLAGITWRPVEIVGSSNQVQQLLKTHKERVFLTLDLQDGVYSFRGRSGCNRYSIRPELGDNNYLSIERVAMSRMFCADVHPLETAYVSALKQVASYQVIDKELHMFNEKHELVVRFIAD